MAILQTRPPLAPAGQLIQVGQRIWSDLYNRGEGIVFKITGEQSPGSVGQLGGGCVSFGGRASFDIVFLDGGMTRGLPESILCGSQWRVYAEIAPPDEIMDALSRANEAAAAHAAAVKATEERRAAERIAHAAAHPHLAKFADKPGYSPGRLAAHNIRIELKAAYPGIKFGVTSDFDSVSIRWSCGPTIASVREITSKYEAGRFDGMNDIYENDPDATFADVFGDPKYVSESREYPEDVFAACCRVFCEHNKTAYIPHRTCGVAGDSRYVENIVRDILGKASMQKTFTGIRPTGFTGAGDWSDFWEVY